MGKLKQNGGKCLQVVSSWFNGLCSPCDILSKRCMTESVLEKHSSYYNDRFLGLHNCTLLLSDRNSFFPMNTCTAHYKEKALPSVKSSNPEYINSRAALLE